MYYYPPPYYSGGQWGYATPWLWYDGNKDGSFNYNGWESMIVNRMAQPAPVTITMWGHYSSADDTGRIYAQFRNDSTDAINGSAFFVITEDSIYSPSPNGDAWHNHVARDYLPTNIGEAVSIPAGDSVTVDRALSFNPAWNRTKCDIVAWVQNDNMQADSTKEIWQGCMFKVTDLTNVDEQTSQNVAQQHIGLAPNPCTNSTKFDFDIPFGSSHRIGIYDVLGRKVIELSGIGASGQESVRWNRHDAQGVRVSAGVYIFVFSSDDLHESGKIVVR